jgi:glycosyltransferase involved in cell wall biosynthesis
LTAARIANEGRSMRVLFIHQNLPGQFTHLVGALCADPDHTVWGICAEPAAERARRLHPKLNFVSYRPPALPADGLDAATRELEVQVRRGRLVARILRQMLDRGMAFDLVVAHPAWGEALFVKDVLPGVPLLLYPEFFHAAEGADVGFDPEHPRRPDDAERLRLRNLVPLSALEACDAAVVPTAWQHARLPAFARAKARVVHEGVDTMAVRPDRQARFEAGGHVFVPGGKTVTFVSRNLEPYRGFHVFMRALPALLEAEPEAQVLVVGGDEPGYGAHAGHAQGWRGRMLEELAAAGTPVDPARVHFVGRLPHAQYVKVLHVSAAHVYLTVPFVLSWSMLEAMAAGAPVIGSRTPPVEEVIEDGVDGMLVDFLDRDALVAATLAALRDPARLAPLRAAARAKVVERYDLRTRCLPAGLALLAEVAARRT